MSGGGERRWWQFSLRSLLFAVVIVGSLAGLFGPPLVRSLRQWSPAADTRPAPTAPATRLDDYESDGYYESGESPLY